VHCFVHNPVGHTVDLMILIESPYHVRGVDDDSCNEDRRVKSIIMKKGRDVKFK